VGKELLCTASGSLNRDNGSEMSTRENCMVLLAEDVTDGLERGSSAFPFRYAFLPSDTHFVFYMHLS